MSQAIFFVLKSSPRSCGTQEPEHHIKFSQAQLHPQSKLSKFDLSSCWSNITVFKLNREIFKCSGSASGFMNDFTPLHESVRLSIHYVSDSLLIIMQNTQVQLSDRALAIVRRSTVIFSGKWFRVQKVSSVQNMS